MGHSTENSVLKLPGLFLDGLDKPWMSVAEIDAPQRGDAIEQGPAADLIEINPLRPLDDGKVHRFEGVNFGTGVPEILDIKFAQAFIIHICFSIIKFFWSTKSRLISFRICFYSYVKLRSRIISKPVIVYRTNYQEYSLNRAYHPQSPARLFAFPCSAL